MLELVQLAAQGERRPAQLSGGQRQRVALARALINQPKVLLLDEPLGALDLKLREEMQIELKSLQRRLGITFVYVTHDQGEALSMADRVAVFNKGRIEQLAAPRELYTRPGTSFVARFVGSANVADGALAQSIDGSPRSFAIRAENVAVSAESAAIPIGDIHAAGVVVAVQYHGAASRWQVRLDAGQVWSALVTEEDSRALNGLEVGTRVKLSWPRDAAVTLGESASRS
jgi:putative spermidine/putrescine transport system ATP-binding protein